MICISSGHSKYVSGARGHLHEVAEARSVVDKVGEYLGKLGVKHKVIHDNVSKTQNTNLRYLVEQHNKHNPTLNVFVHFNSGVNVVKSGTEVWYYSERILSEKLSKAIAGAGKLGNRGAKMSKELYVLKQTEAPAVLIEVCFVNVKKDADAYVKNFDEICRAITEVIANKKIETVQKAPIYRVTVDGKQKGAYSVHANIIDEVTIALGKCKKVEIERV